MTERLLRLVSPQEIRLTRRRPVDRATLDAAAVMLDDIEARGEAAATELAVRFGDLASGDVIVRDRHALDRALMRLAPKDRAVLERTASRITDFCKAQRSCLRDCVASIQGGEAGHTCVPVGAVGCYAPGGRFPLPSSVLMTVIAARCAGVDSVWVASPRPTDATLAAAAVAGAEGVLAIGGVQAIGAMAFGLFGLPACDMIVGPGNRWVTAGKFLVSDRVGIDMLAGPSELVVLADESADPALIASDLLAQAEHDEDAIPGLISTSARVIDLVEACLRDQVATLPTRATALRALRNGFAVVVAGVADAIAVCDRIAPEHLEIMMLEPASIAGRIRSSGAVFIGSGSPEVLGDYGAGPNHVLPTGGTARFKAGLSVMTFLRPRTWMRIDDAAAAAPVIADAAALARMESLEAHARSAEARVTRLGSESVTSRVDR